MKNFRVEISYLYARNYLYLNEQLVIFGIDS